MDIDLINVQVNGELRRAPSGQSVAALLAWLEIPSERVAVELNKAIVRKRDWTTTQVEGEACIEIVEFVGGG
jgi:thiamine biosynthesis protein ThiS